MSNVLPLHVTRKDRIKETFNIEVDAETFERLAASFGFFGSEFLDDLDQAELDLKEGRTRKIKSLKELRKNQS